MFRRTNLLYESYAASHTRSSAAPNVFLLKLYTMSDGGGVLSTLIVYLGGYLFLLLLAICLATGLYYMAELVEEYSRLTKRVITYALRAVLALHLALLLFDRQPVSCVLVGAAAHAAYTRLLPRFPYVQLGSVDFAVAVAGLVASHVLWLRHFWHDTYASAEYVAGFFVVCVWLVPFGFFISIAAGDTTLPGLSGGAPPYAAAAMARDAAANRSRAGEDDLGGRKRSRNLFGAALGSLVQKAQGVLGLKAAAASGRSRSEHLY